MNSEQEVVLWILDWLRKHHKDILDRLLTEVPSAAIILAGESAAEEKLRKLQALEGAED
jgi:hypothetical protein